jgi:hypothetical protein
VKLKQFLYYANDLVEVTDPNVRFAGINLKFLPILGFRQFYRPPILRLVKYALLLLQLVKISH